MPVKLSDSEAAAALAKLPQWSRVESREAITRDFEFKNFSEAFGFMTRSAMKAEQLNHHPEWFNVWNKVSVTLATHDVDGLSELDFKLAAAMDRIAA